MLYTLFAVFFVASIVERSFQCRHEISILEKVRRHPNWKLLDQGTSCGTRFPKVNPRILDGVEAEAHEFPWMTLQMKHHEGVVSKHCGGSLINDRYILTAAHCFREKFRYTIRLGEHEVGKKTCYGRHCTGPKEVEIEEIIPHEYYNNITDHNDICLLRLKEKIKFSKAMYPICLPVFDELQQEMVGIHMTVAGWGYSNKDGSDNKMLNKEDVDIKPKELCQKKWEDEMLLNTQICAGGDRWKDSCGGDSGGPLMFRAPVQGPSRYFAMGIVSSGQDCSTYNDILDQWNLWRPGVYTKVSAFIPWILNKIRP